MRATLFIFILFFVASIHPSFGLAQPMAGPLEVKNQFPLFLPLNMPALESADVQDSFSVQFSYSSIFFIGNSPRWSVYLDMEWTEINLKYEKAFSNNLAIILELPILYFTRGFLDNGLEWYHKTFGFPDYGRGTRPANQFLYQVKKDGQLIIEGEDGKSGIGDLRISAKKILLKMDDQPFLSVKAALELPTGDPDTGFGNGGLDLGLLLQIEKKMDRYLQATGNLGLIIPGPLKAHQTIDLKPYWFGGLGLEVKPWKRLSILGQISAQTSPFPETGLDFIDNPAVVLSLGGRYYRDRNYFELSLTEDLNTTGAPDFIFNFSYKRHF